MDWILCFDSRISTQSRDTVGYTEFSIQLLHAAVALQPKAFSLHVSFKILLEISMNERRPVGSMWCESQTFPIEDKTHGRK